MQLDGTKPFLFIGQLGRNHLIAQATRRLYPLCKDYYDGNWVTTRVEITAGGFRGTFAASLRAEEFLSFRDELLLLNANQSSHARFSSLEEWLTIEIERTGPGNYVAHCAAIDGQENGSELKFQIQFNQTEMPAILKSLDKIVAEFPIIGERRASQRNSAAS